MTRYCDLSKALRAGALGLCLFVLAAPAFAQNRNSNDGATTNANSAVTRTEQRTEQREDTRDDRRVERDDDNDWGWLGLLGLAGLLGLMPKRRVPVVRETREVHDRGADVPRR